MSRTGAGPLPFCLTVVSCSKLCLRPPEIVAPLLGKFDLDRAEVDEAVGREFAHFRRSMTVTGTLCADRVARLDQFFAADHSARWAFLKTAAGE